MADYTHVKSTHQYYRDVFSRELMIGDIGNLPKEIVVDVIVNRSCDIYALNKNLAANQSNLPEAQDRALKLLLNAIALSNLALDENGAVSRCICRPSISTVLSVILATY